MSDGFSQLFSPPLSSGISEKKKRVRWTLWWQNWPIPFTSRWNRLELVGTCFSLGRCLNRWNYVELSNGPWLPGWVAKFVFLEFGNKIVSHWVKNMVVQCYTYTSSQWALAANEMLFQKAVISCQVPMVQSYLGWFEDIWSMSQVWKQHVLTLLW